MDLLGSLEVGAEAHRREMGAVVGRPLPLSHLAPGVAVVNQEVQARRPHSRSDGRGRVAEAAPDQPLDWTLPMT